MDVSIKACDIKLLTAFAGLLGLLLTGAARAEVALTPPEARITDQAVSADMATYTRTQQRLMALNAQGVALADYHLAKAQCWLDVSLHEYTRNDRSPFPQQALAQSDEILRALEQGDVPDGASPLVNDAERLRDDLWDKAAALKAAPGFACYARQLACAEVELVHAGNEYRQQGWRHAKPYVQIAEDLVAEADATGTRCLPPESVAMPQPVPEPPQPVPPVKTRERLEIGADALFAFDRAGDGDLLEAGKAQLDQLVRRLDETYAEIERITLAGHADRLGGAEYNQRLSEQRAETVMRYLRAHGVTAEIVTAGYGASQPLVQCGSATRYSKALAECLQPNRRVGIEVIGVRR